MSDKKIKVTCRLCKKIIVENLYVETAKQCLTEKYVACPYCGGHFLNPLKEIIKEKK